VVINTPSRAAEFEFHTLLPGPTRKRTWSPYRYRLTYRNPQREAIGCALLWEVLGGRMTYQIVLERSPRGELRWHCTCADAVYRGENAPHVCKHVRGLQALGRPQPAPQAPPPPPQNCVGA
jgi:hypothetical protein